MYVRAVFIVAIVLLLTVAAHADTTFTYQGELNANGVVANGPYDMDFALWDALSEGGQIGATINLPDVSVVDGIFTVELDYGAIAFDNSERWLEIVVNSTTLSPRQPITRTPYSIQTRGIVVAENNNVGIGTSTPFYPLDVRTHFGTAIFGQSRVGNGLTFAIEGASESTDGSGVYGRAMALSGTNNGVWGLSQSTSGRGVYGLAINSSGTNYGVYGRTNSTSGRGVYGWATASSGTTHGGRFESDSTTGRGVLGQATADTGLTYGVYGYSRSTTGRGVYGRAAATSGITYGGRFVSDSTSGHGVYSHATASRGINYGGWFQSESTTGRAIFGLADANSGVNFGVVGHSNSSDGYDFWASGAGTDYGSNSSRRWKSNVVPIGDPLTKLAQLRGVYFDWDAEHGGAHDVGMIAEEVGAVMPEIVQYEENGIDAIGMDYSKMTPLLVEAVNALRSESNRRLAEKDDEISELRQQLSDLQQMVERLASNG